MAGGTGLAARVGERQVEPLGQGKDRDRRRATSPKQAGDDTRSRGNVLLGCDRVADHPAADRRNCSAPSGRIADIQQFC
jgi:hypothetical protein